MLLTCSTLGTVAPNGYCYPVLYSYIMDDSGSLLLGNCFSDVKRALLTSLQNQMT